MNTFHGDPQLKRKLLEMLRDHSRNPDCLRGFDWRYRDRDDLVRLGGLGHTFQAESRVIEPGCLIHGSQPETYGIPEWLARLGDCIHLGLSWTRSHEWPGRFARAISVGSPLADTERSLGRARLEQLIELIPSWGLDAFAIDAEVSLRRAVEAVEDDEIMDLAPTTSARSLEWAACAAACSACATAAAFDSEKQLLWSTASAVSSLCAAGALTGRPSPALSGLIEDERSFKARVQAASASEVGRKAMAAFYSAEADRVLGEVSESAAPLLH